MSDSISAPEHWQLSGRPPSLFRRFQFSGYAETRGFLDRLGKLSEATKYYPDISFGTGYANITVHARDGKALTADDVDFAERVSALATSGNTGG
ncbi:MAG: 4a-hydroxytetrahydrobiopterin dehydratase [Gammaproteobacteria bacterium]